MPRRGWLDAKVFADTGVLLAAARNRDCLHRFGAHYGSRLHVADLVEREVVRLASPQSYVDGRVRTAAGYVRTVLIDSRLIKVHELQQEGFATYDEVHSQLRGLPASDPDADPNQHAGEAASIAVCTRLLAAGERVVLLTNDGGASVVAASHGIPARHFAHVLNELVCSGQYTAAEAMELYDYATTVTALPAGVGPTVEDDLKCLASSESCGVCTVPNITSASRPS